MRNAQLPCRFPGETKAMRNPAMIQKAAIPVAAQMPSGEV
jgi:hypothetical protein